MENKLQAVGILLEDEFPEVRVYNGVSNIMLSGGDFPEEHVFLVEAREGKSYYLAVYQETGNDAGAGEQYRKVEERTLDSLTELVRYLDEEYWEG